MKIVMTFTAMSMAKMSSDEHYSEHTTDNIHIQLSRPIQMLIKYTCTTYSAISFVY
jgi:hypothetical protein